MIMHKILEEFLVEIKDLHKTTMKFNDRIILLMIFSRRLIMLNSEKYHALMKLNSYINEIFQS